jgi:ABC-type glycerol-3-phosphate transport system substrate-binding protein
MISSGQTVLLDQAQSNAQAVEFYTDFARPTKVVYGWNDKQKDSLTAFAEGKVAYYLGFTSDEPAIIERGAGLQYDITEVPQVNIQRPLTIAKYNLLGVAKSAKNAPATWNFLQWLTGKTGATLVLNQSLATPARKDLVQALLGTTNPAITVKVGQTLVATSWYSGSNDDQARIVLKELIRTVSTGSMATLEALTDASQKLRLFIK